MPDTIISENLPWTFDERYMRIRDAGGNTLAFLSLAYPVSPPDLIIIGHTLARAAEFLAQPDIEDGDHHAQ